jgi:hypothetical protein
MAGLTREQRASREQELRAADPVHEDYAAWDNDSLLSTEMIPAREGFVQRWVRTTVKGNEDQSNVMKKYNKGWRPRTLDTVPKGQYVMNLDFNGQQVIGIHGMILMERPIGLHNRQKAQIDEQNRLQQMAVKHNLYKDYQSDKSARDYITAPEYDVQSRVSKGRIAPIVDDD